MSRLECSKCHGQFKLEQLAVVLSPQWGERATERGSWSSARPAMVPFPTLHICTGCWDSMCETFPFLDPQPPTDPKPEKPGDPQLTAEHIMQLGKLFPPFTAALQRIAEDVRAAPGEASTMRINAQQLGAFRNMLQWARNYKAVLRHEGKLDNARGLPESINYAASSIAALEAQTQ